VLDSNSVRHSGLQRYSGEYDPLATFANLRTAGILSDYAYLHLSPDQTEIGWAPVQRLQLLTGEPCNGWRGELAAFAQTAEQLDRKAFGYIGFDAVDCHTGTLPDGSLTGRPLVEFIIPGELVSFTDFEVTHRSAGDIDLRRYLAPRLPGSRSSLLSTPATPVNGTPEQAYLDAVRHGITAISAGEARKLVLARYEAYEGDFDPVRLFAALSPPFVDAFLVCFGDLIAVVPSPELLLSGKNGQIVTNPLAGTRPRGETPVEDAKLRGELVENHKEIVEHVLSVKTVLSELDPICAQDTLVVNRFMGVALQRKVQHLSSIVSGSLGLGVGVLDALWALFPAVTVTGLPKSHALRVIRGLELSPRYLYAGAIGWVRGAGDCRFSVAIRGIVRCGTRSFLQAGAGILAESIPEAEWLETSHKLSAMKHSLGWR
jgi:salicylate synthetase